MKKIEIQWVDSFQTHGWHDEVDINFDDSNCKSIGYIYKETDEHITICQNYNNGGIGNLMTIPKISITDINNLT